MDNAWESQLTGYLTDLSAVQARTLDVLGRKRHMLAKTDTEGLATVNVEEAGIVQSLQDCLARREKLLEQAHREGLPSDSIRSLAAALPSSKKNGLGEQLRRSAAQSRLLQHDGLVNWILIQRTLIHLSQLLEIIATGGRLQPTYRKEDRQRSSGALVDRAV